MPKAPTIVSRKAARAQGLSRYFTGQPCSKGHIVPRTVARGDCTECLRERQCQWARKNAATGNAKSAAWYAANKYKAKATRARWREANAEKFRRDVASYQAANKQRLAAASKLWNRVNIDKRHSYTAKYRDADPDHVRALARQWAARNKDKVNAKKARRIASLLRATPSWASANNVAAFYADAARMTQQTGVVHHVDHIVPLRSKRVCGLHCEANLRVITGEANQSKSNRTWPDDIGES